jgi:membrane protein implicated in regulation of membrane protease activity
VVVLWLVVGVVLLLFEMHHLALYALFGAAGAFAAAVVAAVAPGAVPAQVSVAAGVAVAGVVAVRPYVSRALDARKTGHVIRGVHGGLVGGEAVTLDEVGDAHRGGHVRLTGERWLAVSGAGTVIPPHAPVIVTAVQGTTLVVWPLDGTGAAPPEVGPAGSGPSGPRPAGPDDAPEGADGRTT